MNNHKAEINKSGYCHESFSPDGRPEISSLKIHFIFSCLFGGKNSSKILNEQKKMGLKKT
ncbi:hypothetical protein LEP1GSC194_1825 [Leptospira alstonii serovar Sichuan str. 79601]|uniref:Uncharacterized protein n=1 Tax=Leptospira alstonii serovar Sichuan str. 79601 TaxID=1218565 RepID=M6CNB7_9LEPT|nr:hypothetical protein LEP1GSC194_1825 [Leptospira alstonii serovar Sichuan str. 79601]